LCVAVNYVKHLCHFGSILSTAINTGLLTLWNQLYLLNSLVSSDKGFKDFVIQHIDETAGDKTRIFLNGHGDCHSEAYYHTFIHSRLGNYSVY
jgi:hypothetical protein